MSSKSLTIESGWYVQSEYLKVDLWGFTNAVEQLPKDDVEPISGDLNMKMRNSLNNYTTTKNDEVDDFGGTLSAATLQTIIEYTTRPGGTVVTFNAQFGAMYLAGDNCGRRVFGTESYSYFKTHASDTVTELVGVIVPEQEEVLNVQTSNPRRKKKTVSKGPHTCEFSSIFLR